MQQFTGYSFSNKRHKNETIGGPFARRHLYSGVCDSVSWWLVTSLAEVASFYGNVELSMMSPNFTEGIINLISKRGGCLDVNIPMVCNFIEGIAVLWINKLDGEDRISLNVPTGFYPPNLWTHQNSAAFLYIFQMLSVWHLNLRQHQSNYRIEVSDRDRILFPPLFSCWCWCTWW